MHDANQEIISSIHYTVVERFIENFEQQRRHIEHPLAMTKKEIYSYTHRFQLNHVLDMSYKPFTNGNGILYLHTNEGVFSYFISSNPEQFIQTFKRLLA